ncbi:hypothetical protein MPER_00179, partial [Moniliophthora perniciosa FA553]
LRCKSRRWRGLDCVWEKTNDTQQDPTPLSAPRTIPIDVTSLRGDIVATFVSAASRPEAAITVPQLSWSNPLLLHALLSFTALHLRRLYPTEPKWVYLASAHQKAAIDALPSADNADTKFLSIGFFT